MFFILEILNNIIQYQFDGNCNLVYTIIRKRNVFFNLLNLPVDQPTIDSITTKKTNKKFDTLNEFVKSMDGAIAAKEAEPGTLKATLAETPSILKMTEKTVSTMNKEFLSDEPKNESVANDGESYNYFSDMKTSNSSGQLDKANESQSKSSISSETAPTSPNSPTTSDHNAKIFKNSNAWKPTTEWVSGWKSKLPLQTIMRLLQVLVPQVEKICIDKGLTDESEILKFLQNGTLVGLLPVPHPILIRKYQPNLGTLMWFRTYMWGVIYLRLVFFGFFLAKISLIFLLLFIF